MLTSQYWFSGHCHINYSVRLENGKKTRFYACDKVQGKRDYLTVIDIPVSGEIRKDGTGLTIRYDAEWLAILKATEPLLLSPSQSKAYFYYSSATKQYQLTAEGTAILAKLKLEKERLEGEYKAKQIETQVCAFIPNPIATQPSPQVNPQTRHILDIINSPGFKYDGILYVQKERGMAEANDEEISLDLSDCESPHANAHPSEQSGDIDSGHLRNHLDKL